MGYRGQTQVETGMAVQRHPARVATKDVLGGSLGVQERQDANVWEIQEERGGTAIGASFPVHTRR